METLHTGEAMKVREELENSPLWANLTPEERTALLFHYTGKLRGVDNHAKERKNKSRAKK